MGVGPQEPQLPLLFPSADYFHSALDELWSLEHFREAVVKSVHDGGIVMPALFRDSQIKVAIFEVIAILEDISMRLHGVDLGSQVAVSHVGLAAAAGIDAEIRGLVAGLGERLRKVFGRSSALELSCDPAVAADRDVAADLIDAVIEDRPRSDAAQREPAESAMPFGSMNSFRSDILCVGVILLFYRGNQVLDK